MVLRRAAAVLLTALALAGPGAALAAAQSSPFSPLPPAPAAPAETPTPAPSPGDPGGSDVGRNTLYAIAGGLVVAFAAIGLWISRDARRNLPPEDRAAASRLREEGPHRKARQAKRKARAKGRAARAARKRTKRAR
jgi:hypothetical protein